MAGKVVVSTLNDDTGVLATQNGMTGVAKAWVNYNVSTGATSIRGSFNVSSVTYVATGQSTINYTTAMPNANYSFQATASGVALGNQNTFAFIPENGTFSASATSIGYVNDGGGSRNPVYVCVAVFSS